MSMSTTVYLVCKTHGPNLTSDEVGQHLYDLENIRGYIANRELLVGVINAGYDIGGYDNPNWSYTAAHFLREHPNCDIGIVDEYGEVHANEALPSMPSKSNGYYVIGKCACGELLTVTLGTSISGVERTSPELKHVSNMRRECGTKLATVVEYRKAT
jgi:hypothetical protein